MRLLIKNVRLSYPKLWTPEAFPGGNDPTPYFSAGFIIPPTHPQFAEFNAAIDVVGSAYPKFAGKWPAIKKAATALGKICLRDGDSKADQDGFEGNWFFNARSKIKPTTFDRDKVEVSESSGIIYGGCYVDVSVELFAYSGTSKGIAAGLRGVRFVNAGDRFGGGSAAEADEFDDLEDQGETDPLVA